VGGDVLLARSQAILPVPTWPQAHMTVICVHMLRSSTVLDVRVLCGLSSKDLSVY
jgi:hypothetical protein